MRDLQNALWKVEDAQSLLESARLDLQSALLTNYQDSIGDELTAAKIAASTLTGALRTLIAEAQEAHDDD